MSASVKVMLSYDYCHFEICKGTDRELTDGEINEMRKDCQRLADNAVRQYKIAKEMASKRNNSAYEEEMFERECREILQKPEGERTVNEIAKLKQYQDENWRSQFSYSYDYDDEEDKELYP